MSAAAHELPPEQSFDGAFACVRCGRGLASTVTVEQHGSAPAGSAETTLLRIRESKLQLEVQQLVARNRELELQLKVYTMAQPSLRVAEAEGARWCAPSFRLASARGLVPAMPST